MTIGTNPCLDVFRQVRLPLLTSEAVLTELDLCGQSKAELEAAWKFVRSGALCLAVTQDQELPPIHALMSRYCPRDFPDATLVYLAERESLSNILTVDRKDFQIYRIGGNRRFRVLPALP